MGVRMCHTDRRHVRRCSIGMSTDDGSFHPLGSEWEDELEEMLDDTEYDTDLGMEMAQDAMRVTKGELSEAEFHERYHEDVMAEFDVDDRPTEAAYEQAKEDQQGSMGRMLDAFDGDGEETRRETMKKMGAGAAAVGLGAWGTVDDDDRETDLAAAQDDDHGHDDDGVQWGMAIDLERCDGCLSCVEACATENNLDQGVNWMYVLEYDEPDGDSGRSRNRLVRPCQHCTDAPCEKVCPTTARHTRDSDGLVLTDYDVCIGCRYCQVACPYGVNYFQWDEPDVSTDQIADQHADKDGDHMTDDRDRWVDSRAPRGVMSKCTMCPSRQDGHMGEDRVGTTACEEACPPDAIQFGDMNDPDSDPNRYLQNVVHSRAEAMVDGANPNADDVRESYAFLDGEIGLEELDYLLDDWSSEEVEAVMYYNEDLEEDDLEHLTDDEYDSVTEALREVFRGILEPAFEDEDDEVDEDELDATLEAVLDALLEDGDEDGIEDDLETAEDALAAVLEETEASAEEIATDTVERYESREITPAEVEESLAILDGEDEPWVTEDGITDEDTAQQVLETYAGDEASTFKLLEDMGTNPNVRYIGNEPGPEAEQREPTGTGAEYENIRYRRADGERVSLVDNRKEVLDDKTVGDVGWSL